MNKLLVTIVILCIGGCQNKQPNIDIPSFEVMSHIEKKKLSDMVDSVRYVPLETNENSLIGSISRIVVTENRIFIGDKVANGVFVFDKRGFFLNKICRQGRSPEEYVRLYDFDVSEADSSIYFYVGRKIQVYDYNGNYRQSIPLHDSKLSPITLSVSKKDIYLSMNYNVYDDPQAYNSVFINHEGFTTEQGSPYMKEIAGQINYSPRLYFRYKNDTLVYFNNFENIVYKHFDGKTKPIFKIDFSSHNVPTLHGENINKFLRTRFHDYALPYNVTHINDKYYILFLINDIRYMSVVSLKERISQTVNISEGLEYDNSLTDHFLDFMCVENNSFVTYYDWSDAPELFSKLNVSDDNNPIIVFYHIK